MHDDHDEKPDFQTILTTEEIAVALRVHPATVRRWVRRGAPALGTSGGHLRFSLGEVMAWLRKGDEVHD